MMILRKKEIVAAAMVVLVGMAGYLNWHYQDNITVRDGESYVEAGKKIGETQLVIKEEKGGTDVKEKDTEKTDKDDFFEKAAYDREVSRSKALEILNDTAVNESFDKEIRKKAQDEILKIAENVENEVKIENIAKAKGYEKIYVYISEENVNISVQKDGFNESDAAKIQEIATEQLKILPNKIKIVEVK